MKIIMKRSLALLSLSVLFAGCQTTDITTTHDRSPHAEAIALVMATQTDTIKTVDREDWWFDTKSREWTAVRPFGPGIFDSTHTFIVRYKIDGSIVAEWMVDTKLKAVDLVSPR